MDSRTLSDIININSLRTDDAASKTVANAISRDVSRFSGDTRKEAKGEISDRPGLKRLQELTRKLEQEGQYGPLLDKISHLQKQNSSLQETVCSLQKQLDVEKKLRKFIENNRNGPLLQVGELSQISGKLEKLKAKYRKSNKTD